MGFNFHRSMNNLFYPIKLLDFQGMPLNMNYNVRIDLHFTNMFTKQFVGPRLIPVCLLRLDQFYSGSWFISYFYKDANRLEPITGPTYPIFVSACLPRTLYSYDKTFIRQIIFKLMQMQSSRRQFCIPANNGLIKSPVVFKVYMSIKH